MRIILTGLLLMVFSVSALTNDERANNYLDMLDAKHLTPDQRAADPMCVNYLIPLLGSESGVTDMGAGNRIRRTCFVGSVPSNVLPRGGTHPD
jgi:hypothetical protein